MITNNKNKKKTFLLFMMFCLIFSTYGPTVFGAEWDAMDKSTSSRAVLSDLKNHWAEKPLTEWMEAGIIAGYSDGTFKPDRIVNRGEAIVLINRSFGFSEKTSIGFTDISTSAWEYEDAAKAVKAGYINGYADGTIGTKRSISRQEAAVIIARLLGLDVQAGSEAASSFADAKQIPQWSEGAVAAVAAAKIMKGYEDGSFKPLASITRAEVVVTLDRALKSRSEFEYNQAGTYGSATDDVQTISGNVVVNASGVTLQNMKITGNLLLAEGIAEGDVFLNNVAVLGTTTVKGGGINSIHVENSALAIVIVDKASSVVRIVANGGTIIGEVIVMSSVILEQSGTSSPNSTSGFNLVRLTNALPSASVITLSGHFDQVDVEAKDSVITFTQGVINQLSVAEQAAGTSIHVNENANIISLILHEIAKVMGQGVIEKAMLSEKAKGTTFDKQPQLLLGAAAPVSGSTGTTGTIQPAPTASPAPTAPTASPSPTASPAPTDPPAVEEIVSYSAVNGSITVLFNKLPSETLVIGDFVVKQIIDGTDEMLVNPSGIAWHAAEKKAVLTMPTIPLKLMEQNVVYRVSYKERTTVDITPFVVPVFKLAENGTIRFVFSEEPEHLPVLGDFKIERMDNGTIVTPTKIEWDATILTATLTVPRIATLPWEQYVDYEVAYDSKEPLRTNSFTIARKKGYTSVLANSSFEQWTNGNADSWILWGEGFTASDTIKRSGQYSLTVNGLSPQQNEVGGGTIQDVNLVPGHYVGVYHYLTSAQTAGTLRYVLQFQSEEGYMIGSTEGEIQQGVTSNGKWTTASFEFDVASHYSGLQMGSAKLILMIQNFDEGERLYLDDIELIRKDDVVPIMLASAENGTVRFVFSEEPEQVPAEGDFKVMRMDNGAIVTLTNMEWDVTTLTAKLTVPRIALLPWEQFVEYNVAYDNNEPIRTNTVTIARQEGYTSVLANSSFEQWTNGMADNWSLWGEGFTASDTIKRSGQYSLTVNGLSPQQNQSGGGGAIQIKNLEPGHYVMVYHYLTSAQTAGTLVSILQYREEHDYLIGSTEGVIQQGGASNGKWTTASVEFEVNSRYSDQQMTSALLLLNIRNFQAGERVYLDDIELIRKDDVVPLMLASAENGTLWCVFTKEPEQMPVKGDFKVMRMDNGSIVTPTNMEWDAAKLTAKLTVPSIVSLPWEQYVDYDVTYASIGPIQTNTVTIARQEGYTSILANSSFEQWTNGGADGWLLWGEGFTRSDTVKRSGQYSLTVNGLSANQNKVGGGGPIQLMTLEPGHYIGVYHYLTTAWVPGNLQYLKAKLRYILQLKDENGLVRGTAEGPIQLGGISNGKWMTASFEFDVNPNYGGVRMASAQLILNIQNFFEGEKVYLDDIELIRQDKILENGE